MNSEFRMGPGFIGAQLKSLRKERHLTQEQVAKLAGISNTTVSEVERAEDPDMPPAVDKVARALGLELVRHYELRPLRRSRRSV